MLALAVTGNTSQATETSAKAHADTTNSTLRTVINVLAIVATEPTFQRQEEGVLDDAVMENLSHLILIIA